VFLYLISVAPLLCVEPANHDADRQDAQAASSIRREERRNGGVRLTQRSRATEARTELSADSHSSAGGGVGVADARDESDVRKPAPDDPVVFVFVRRARPVRARCARGPARAVIGSTRVPLFDLCCSVPLCRGEPLLALLLGGWELGVDPFIFRSCEA
jgi:hypothetical protein